MKVEIIPCLQDNYSYLIIDNEKQEACVVDPSEAKPIINYLNDKNIKLKSRSNIPNGIISLKGGELEDELKNLNNYKIFEISDFFSNDFFKTKKIVFIPYSN